MNQESETAGLGAEIKDNAQWQGQFKGKHLFASDNSKIALSVVKKGTVKNPDYEVDGVTGATLTSNGVSAMLKADKGGLQPYVKFLSQK